MAAKAGVLLLAEFTWFFFFLLLNSGKSNTSKKAKAGPSREEIHEVVVKILKEVDFNTVSVSFYFQ